MLQRVRKENKIAVFPNNSPFKQGEGEGRIFECWIYVWWVSRVGAAVSIATCQHVSLAQAADKEQQWQRSLCPSF